MKPGPATLRFPDDDREFNVVVEHIHVNPHGNDHHWRPFNVVPVGTTTMEVRLISTNNKEDQNMASVNSIHFSTTGNSRTSPPPADNSEVRATVADVVREALSNSDDIDDALIIEETRDNSGPMGGVSSSILAYVRLPDSPEPVAVAINVYANDKIAEKAEARLDELEKRTALADRLDRVRGLIS